MPKRGRSKLSYRKGGRSGHSKRPNLQDDVQPSLDGSTSIPSDLASDVDMNVSTAAMDLSINLTDIYTVDENNRVQTAMGTLAGTAASGTASVRPGIPLEPTIVLIDSTVGNVAPPRVLCEEFPARKLRGERAPMREQDEPTSRLSDMEETMGISVDAPSDHIFYVCPKTPLEPRVILVDCTDKNAVLPQILCDEFPKEPLREDVRLTGANTHLEENLGDCSDLDAISILFSPVVVHSRPSLCSTTDEIFMEPIQFTRENEAALIEFRRNAGAHHCNYLLAARRNDNVSIFGLGPFTHSCIHCTALHFNCEKFKSGAYAKCCSGGKVALPPLYQTPNLLKRLLDGQHPLSKHFRTNLIRFNYLFQFASVQANIRQFENNRGPFVYAIQGKIFHQISNVDLTNARPRYGPMYFLNPHDAAAGRVANDDTDLSEELIHSLEEFLRSNNPFAQGYVHLKERYEIERTLAELQNRPMPNLVLEFVDARGREHGTFDAPMVNEVAVVYTADEGTAHGGNLRVFLRDRPDRFHDIPAGSPLSDPLSYPLLFPSGDMGWSFDTRSISGQRAAITLLDFYSYRLAYRVRGGEIFQIFQWAGKLFQQYVVTSYIKIEHLRLQFVATHQGTIRSELYAGLADYLHRYGEQHDLNIGRMVILPSTFIGSPRSMAQFFYDSLAIVHKLGKPSLFITMTCNPKWDEIIDNIPPHDEPGNHPLLISRVFRAKLTDMLHEIELEQILGKCIGRLFVIEFQKRGLPHAHIILIMAPEDRLEDAAAIDAIIRAELPDKEQEPNLYQLICQHNIHGPCSTNAPCMVKGKCAKFFPKPYTNETTIDDKGFVIYKRRDIGQVERVLGNGQRTLISNGFVVPYNPYLTLRYRCHINVEACPSMRAIKYLYKYVWKGADQCLVRVTAENDYNYDEIEAYLSGRYMAPPEASWRILSFPLHGNTHTVIRLPVHLPNEQSVLFEPGNIQRAIDRNHTQLTRWFELNQHDENARQYLYAEIPLHYVWKTTDKNWHRRQRGGANVISRIHSVSVRQGELYYLRLLLLNVRGAPDWQTLRTVDGVVFGTFREACSVRALLQDDLEWERCLGEASTTRMPRQIRLLFVSILVFVEVGDPLRLWDAYSGSMIEDYIYIDASLSEDAARQMALVDIQRALAGHNKRLRDFNLPDVDLAVFAEDIVDVVREREQGSVAEQQLNAEQRVIFDAVKRAVSENDVSVLPPTERLFVLDSPGGTGKTFLLNTLISTLAGEGRCVVSCAFTGIAATNLTRGRTLHSTFKLSLNIDETSTSSIRPNSAEGRRMATAALLIIDEISMVSRLILDVVDRTLQDLTNVRTPFGGKVLLLSGDFRQLLPVVHRANRATIVDKCAKNSVLWPLFSRYELERNVRAASADDAFRQWLLAVGDGTIPTTNRFTTEDLIQIPHRSTVATLTHLIHVCFADVALGRCHNNAILTPYNDTCVDINTTVLGKLEGVTRSYCSADRVDEEDENVLGVTYATEFLNGLLPTGFPPHKLYLKVGAVVMLLRNLDVRQGLCNGTKLLIRDLHTNFISAEPFSLGALTGNIVFLPRIDLSTAGTSYEVPFKRRQFPIRLAYAITINKSQGQTLNTVGIYLPKPVFSHGALYVAASRARAFSSLHICVEDTNEQGAIMGREGTFTKNVVYPEVLM